MIVPAAPIDVALHIGGDIRKTGSGGVFDHVNAHSGRKQASIPLAGRTEIEDAVRAAASAFDSWKRWKPADRRDILLALGNCIEARAEQFAQQLSLENGTPIGITSHHAARAKSWFSYYAGWADKIDGTVTSSCLHGEDLSYTVSEPFGVVAIIIPWNGPLISLAMKLAPALAAGNCLVVKPPELAPFSSELVARCIREAGFPEGVCNILPGGPEAGEALVSHSMVEKISFTGGAATARKIIQASAVNMTPTVMELGGKSANIVFADADLDVAAQQAAFFSVTLMSGQGCCLPTRLLVQAEVYDALVDKVAAIVSATPVGDPFDPAVLRGPVVNSAAAERILGTIARAEREGGRIVCGGGRMGGALANGAYVESTVVADVDPQSDLGQNEVFGPVLAITRFTDEADAIRIANGTRYGLGAFLHTRDVARAHRVAAELKSGGVFINGGNFVLPNSPFGGVGISGYGREGGRAGLDEFLRTKTVAIGAT